MTEQAPTKVGESLATQTAAQLYTVAERAASAHAAWTQQSPAEYEEEFSRTVQENKTYDRMKKYPEMLAQANVNSLAALANRDQKFAVDFAQVDKYTGVKTYLAAIEANTGAIKTSQRLAKNQHDALTYLTNNHKTGWQEMIDIAKTMATDRLAQMKLTSTSDMLKRVSLHQEAQDLERFAGDTANIHSFLPEVDAIEPANEYFETTFTNPSFVVRGEQGMTEQMKRDIFFTKYAAEFADRCLGDYVPSQPSPAPIEA